MDTSERAYVELEIPSYQRGRHVLQVDITDLNNGSGAEAKWHFVLIDLKSPVWG